MARTLSTFTNIVSQRRTGQWIPLLEVTLYRDRFGGVPTSTVLRFSDRARYLLGQEWLPLVAKWGSYRHGMTTPGSLDVVVSQRQAIAGMGVQRFTDVLRHGLNVGTTRRDFTMCEATLYIVPAGGVASDEILIARLVGEEPVRANDHEVELRFSGPELFLDMTDGALLTRIPPAVEALASGSTFTSQLTNTTGPLTVLLAPQRLLLVLTSVEFDRAVTGVVWNGGGGQALTKIAHLLTSPDAFARVEAWGLLQPQAGTGTVTVTVGVSTYQTAAALLLVGVDPADPVGTVATRQATGISHSLDVACREGDLIVDVIGFWFESGVVLPTATPGASQVHRTNLVGGDERVRGGTSTRRGFAPTTAMAWTLSNSRQIAQLAVPVHAAAPA